LRGALEVTANGCEIMSSVTQKGFLKVQLVFVSKCRFKVFKNEKTLNACKEAFKEVEVNHGIVLEEVSFPENHVHSFANIPSNLSIQKAIQLLKGVSARRIFQAVPNLKKRYPRGSFWSGYYNYSSVGPQTESVVKEYIQNQNEHHHIPDSKQLTLSVREPS
jgi:putative transposase